MEEKEAKESDYAHKIHPYIIRNKPKTFLQALFSQRSRLVINVIFSNGMIKCKEDNSKIYEKERKEKLPFEEKTFKTLEEIDRYCTFHVNKMVRREFLKVEWEMYDCFEECERTFPKDHFKYFDLYIFRRIPCFRRCEDVFNDKGKPICQKLDKEINLRDFSFVKKYNE